jgi:glycosyltransferase involved in cell wall biosynthesis
MILPVLFYALVTFTTIQVIYYLFFAHFIFSKPKKKNSSKEIPISVIICAKNEAENLRLFLVRILEQNYKSFEVLLIDDASTDETPEIMEAFAKEYSRINIVTIKNIEAFWGNKKYALTLGIKAAKNEHLLFTDADCIPMSKEWISEMAENFTEKKTIILGYGKYKRQSSFINLCVRYETLLTALQFFTYAKLGSPYMGVGRNLAYTKTDFFNTNGFMKHMHLKSGDDDLFIQEAATSKNTAFCTSENSFTASIAPNSFKEWFQQKRRHVSTSKYYKLRHQMLLSLFFISKVFLLLSATMLFFFYSWKTILPLIFFYYSVQYIVIGFAAKKFKEAQLIYFLPFLEISLLLFQFSIFSKNMISKPTHWK